MNDLSDAMRRLLIASEVQAQATKQLLEAVLVLEQRLLESARRLQELKV